MGVGRGSVRRGTRSGRGQVGLAMGNTISCGQCGELIPDEAPGASEREPCPICGSTTRTYQASAAMTTTSSVSVQATVITYPQRLLTLARSLIDGGECEVGIVVVHMACEVATERSLSDAFTARGLDYLKGWATKSLGYNLANDRVRDLYAALTDDAVEQTSFWRDFKKSSVLRNKLVHGGASATGDDAEDSIRAGSSLVAHLDK